VLGILVGSAGHLAAQEAAAARVNGEEPVVDGRLEDPTWRYAIPVADFLQRNPVEGAVPSESTEVRFAYTDHDLYVAFRGFDRQPDRVYGRLVRRDQRASSDDFSLFLDSYHDKRTAFEFTINPSGARRDVLIYDDGFGRDDSWDPVFDWATRRDSLGWTVEMRIPFSQLRFSRRDSLVFGLRVRRSINRRNEELNWPFFPRDQAGEVSHYGTLVGLVDVPRPQRLELLPYVAGSSSFEPSEEGNPFATGRNSSGRIGADLKLGVTSGLTLDLTANPDFGQVEADAAVVNLSEFESFFPEKRPFFVEGINLFQFGLAPSERRGFGGGGGRGGEEGLVYTRRIGRAPQVSADDDEGYAEEIGQTTILSAAKLSGQVGSGWSVGLAQAVTAKQQADIVDAAGVPGQSPVEPLTSYTVLRAERSLRNGRLAYGAIATGTVRHLDELAFDELHSRAFTAGLDVGGRFGGDGYEFALALMGSRVEGSEEAILETQERSARYFQRPDQTHMRVDSSRTSLSGLAAYARLAKPVGFVTWRAQVASRSPAFEVNDLGFQRQADVHAQEAELEVRWLEPGRVFREFSVELQEQANFTYGWERTQTTLESSVSAEFLNYWTVDVNVERRFSADNTRLLRGGPALAEPGEWELRLSGRTDFRRSLWARAGFNHNAEDASGAKRWGVNGQMRWRPPGSFSFSLEGRARWGATDRQYVTQETPNDSTFYVLGRLNRKEASLTLRADVVLSPHLSLELYAEPFVSAGRYDALRLAADPRADRYADRFDPLGGDRITRPGNEEDIAVDVDVDGVADFSFSEPDFRVVSLRTNAVLRWEFRPGSTLFLVWQQNRGDEVQDATRGLSGGLGDAFGAPGSHVLAVKISYWLGL
jgi:hypothetical protein